MTRAVVVVACFAAAMVGAAARGSAQAGVTPVQKVIQLLTGMVEKGKNEKHEEQIQFASYKQFCDDTTTAKQLAIKEANEAIDVLQADMQKSESDAARLGEEIARHDDDISTWEGDKRASSQVREIENQDYIATHKDYSESIQALQSAIAVMQEELGTTEQAGTAAASLSQISALPRLPAEPKRILEAFIAQDVDENLAVDAGSPQAAGYSSQSGGIVDMLIKLVAKFEDERTELEKEEVKAVHEYELLSQDLQANIERGTADRTAKAEAKAQSLQAAADSKGDLTDNTQTRDDDAKYLADLTATCQQKSSDFEARQELRAGEIEALEKALEILSSGAVAGAADKHLAGAGRAGLVLVQVRSASMQPEQLKVAAYLKRQGLRLNSRVLSAIAMRVSDDPFKKVKKMLKDLVVKLMEEANDEAEHKGWCDTELRTNEHTRKEKTEGVELLTAGIDELQSSISNIQEDIAELTQAISELDAAVAKATSIRQEEKAKNTEAIADARAAQTAVAQALNVLREFYAKAGEATSFLQEPEIFDEPYKGQQGENGGVVGMIEVIQSDFARLEAETTAAESESVEEYTKFMKDSGVDKAQKSSDLDHKNSKKQNHEEALQEHKKDLEEMQTELDAAMQYYEKLKPTCLSTGESYEDRVARRKEEIESLQEALRILSGEDVA